MRLKPIVRLLLGLMLIFVGSAGLIQLQAQRRFQAQEFPADFPAPVADAGMNRACVTAALEQYPGAQLDWALATIRDGGFVWVRQHFPWRELEPTPGAFDWAAWDRVVAQAVAHGLQLIPVLDAPPDWAGTPPDAIAFARFAGAFANHYMAQLSYYEVWHNPNLGDSWGGQADPNAYADLLARAAGAIRSADPEARIILGSLAPNVEAGPQNYAEPRFLELLYAAGAAPYFDVVSVQPYGFDAGPGVRDTDMATLNFARPLLVRAVLEAHSEGNKAIWAGNFGWNSLPPAWDVVPSIWGSVDEAAQAAYLVGALARAEREWPWMGVMCINSFQPRPGATAQAVPDAEEHWGFALVGPDAQPRPAFAAVRAWAARERVAGPGVHPGGTALADFTGQWRIGPLGADIGFEGESRVILQFEGTGVALTVRRGPYLAFLFVAVDGKPAPALPRDEQGRAYIVLYDPLAELATVPLAEDLPAGRHTVEIIAERGWYQWALADWRVTARPDPRPYRLGLGLFAVMGVVGLALTATAARRTFSTLAAGFKRLAQPCQTALAVILAGVFGFAVWTTWAEGAFRRLGEGAGLTIVLLAASLFYFSPWLLLALASGALLFLLVALQPGLGLALTIAAAPLYLHPVSLFGRSFSLAEVLLLPTLAGCALRSLAQWRGRGKIAPVDIARLILHGTRRSFFWPVMSLVAVSILSTLFAAHQREALRELRLVILEPVLFFLALTFTPLHRRERQRVVDFFVASAVAIAMIGLVQYFFLGDVITAEGGARRLRSIYGSPNNVGLYLGRVLPLLLAVAAQGASELASRRINESAETLPQRGRAFSLTRFFAFPFSRAAWYALALLPVGAALALSLSRGAILLAAPVGLIALGLLAGGGWRKATFIALLLLALALIPLFSTPRFARLLDPTQGTTFLRISLWRSAWAMFLDHPWLGVGPDNFLYAYRTRYVLPSAWEEFNLSHPHNWILDFASRLGVLGLGVFVWLQSCFWQRGLKLARAAPLATRVFVLGMLASMAAALAHGLVDAAYFTIDLAFVFFLTLAVIGERVEDVA